MTRKSARNISRTQVTKIVERTKDIQLSAGSQNETFMPEGFAPSPP